MEPAELASHADVRGYPDPFPQDNLFAQQRFLRQHFGRFNDHVNSFANVQMTLEKLSGFSAAMSDSILSRAAELGGPMEPLRNFLGNQRQSSLVVGCYLVARAEGDPVWVVVKARGPVSPRGTFRLSGVEVDAIGQNEGIIAWIASG